MKPRIRKHFFEFERETYANDIKEGGDYLDCSLGTNPYGFSKMVAQNVKSDSWLISQYPKYIKERIIEFWSDIVKLNEVNIFFDAGTYGVIERINKLFICEKSKVLGYCPQFTDYITDVRSCGGTYDYILMNSDNNFKFDANEILLKIDKQYNLVYLDNPNNPTGQIIPLSSIYDIAKKAEEYYTAVLVDESYGDYMDKTNSAISLINKLENLFVTRSFSKGYGLGGLRIGYVVLSTELSSYYSKVSHPFPANALGFYLAHIAMEDDVFLQESKRLIQVTKNEIIKTCERLKVLETNLSVPIMTLVHPDKGVDLHAEFLNKNVITCSGKYFIGLGKNYTRIRIPQVKELQRLIKAIKIIEEGGNFAT